jgi:hypothetical protein
VVTSDLTIHRNRLLKAILRREEPYVPELKIAYYQKSPLLRKRPRENDLEGPKLSKLPTSDDLSGENQLQVRS